MQKWQELLLHCYGYLHYFGSAAHNRDAFLRAWPPQVWSSKCFRRYHAEVISVQQIKGTLSSNFLDHHTVTPQNAVMVYWKFIHDSITNEFTDPRASPMGLEIEK